MGGEEKSRGVPKLLAVLRSNKELTVHPQLLNTSCSCLQMRHRYLNSLQPPKCYKGE